ncbi:hypothetical protein [Paenibacillus sp. DMB20]|uniref:hypothetical protein n=1 Tax=Paenibacillus sp. DMB20 TaxID=1642570 RepID=UPI00062799E8|nr:hypothetical protein [Paenibacillus sp. DMB20]KKO53219.1 hypothetical protein XI25_14720 [Paenibacillus sp. DMB20]
MRIDILNEMHKHSHGDEQRYRLLMRYLRLLDQEKKQRGFLKKFKKQWKSYMNQKEADRKTTG